MTKGHPIKSVTIDQYITHVADYLVTNEYILSGGELRSRRLSMLLAGYTASDDVGVPLRLRQKIPMTYPIACIMHCLAATMHAGAKRLAFSGGAGNGLWPVAPTRRVPRHGGGNTVIASSERE